MPMTCGIESTFTFKGKFEGGTWSGCGVDFRDSTGTEIFVTVANDTEIAIGITSSTYEMLTGSKVAPDGTVSGTIWCWSDGTIFTDSFSVVGAGTGVGSGGTGGTGGSDSGGAGGTLAGGAGGAGGAMAGAAGSP